MPRLRIFSALLIIAAAGLFIRELVTFSQDEDRIPAGVQAGGIAIGGLSRTEASTLLERTFADPITLYYGDNPIILDPSSIGFRVSTESMLADATSVTESEGNFWIRFYNYLTQQEDQQTADLPLSATYQNGLLEQILQDIADRYDQTSGEAGYDIGTLTTFSGSNGTVLNMDRAINLVDEALHHPDNRVVILPTGGIDSDRPSIDTLENLIISYLDSEGFIYDGLTTTASVFILDLETGEEINILGDVAYSAASTIKVAILIDYFHMISRDPTSDEAWLMANSLLCSRNSSSNLLMEIIGGQNIFAGIASVTNTIQYLGARNTFISAPFVEGVEGQQLGSITVPATSPNPNYNTDPDDFNQTTAEDMGTIFSLLYDCAQYGSGLATAYPEGDINQTECRRMLELMSANDLQRLLQGGIPANTRISHKNGWLTEVVGDAGVVYSPAGHDYVIAVYLWEQTDEDFQDFQRLWPLVEGISRATWNYFNPNESLLRPRELPASAQECEGNYLPPQDQVNLDDINAWRNGQ